MSSSPLNRDQLAALQKYDTPTVCNVVELFDVRPRSAGFMNDSIRCCFPHLPPMVGARRRSAACPAAAVLRAWRPGVRRPLGPAVWFPGSRRPISPTTFGEVMCSVYKSFGAAGLITSGAGRDLDQVEAIKFPAFTNGTICAHGYCHMLHMNITVTVGGLIIEPGVLLHGDRNGVTTIPAEVASEVADGCKELMAAEQIILDYVRGPNPTVAGFAESRKASTDAINKLGQRLRKK
jgi:hypothetical protein